MPSRSRTSPRPGRVPPGLLLLGALLAGALSGCGSRPEPVLFPDEIGRYQRDSEAVPPGPMSAGILAKSRTRLALGQRLMTDGKADSAKLVFQTGLADARTALDVAESERAEQESDSCLRSLERSRVRWQSAVEVLVQTEQIARRSANELSAATAADEQVSIPELPTSVLGLNPPPGPAPQIAQAWTAWMNAAASNRVSTADLEQPYLDEMAAAAADSGSKVRPFHLYLAGRALQSLEARVRQAASEEVCARADIVSARLSDARDSAFQGVLDLERGLKADLRSELEKVRADAETRQQSLYEALQQIQGKYATITREARGTIVSLPDILFDFGKATLKLDAEFNLVRVATILNQFPEMRIAVEGHTDNVGTPEYNLTLSTARAQAVHDFLVSQGVVAERMTVQGYGMTRPVSDNDTDEGRARNRRVDLVIEEQPGQPAPGTQPGQPGASTPMPPPQPGQTAPGTPPSPGAQPAHPGASGSGMPPAQPGTTAPGTQPAQPGTSGPGTQPAQPAPGGGRP